MYLLVRWKIQSYIVLGKKSCESNDFKENVLIALERKKCCLFVMLVRISIVCRPREKIKHSLLVVVIFKRKTSIQTKTSRTTCARLLYGLLKDKRM